MLTGKRFASPTAGAVLVALVMTAAMGVLLTGPRAASAALAPKPNLSLAKVISTSSFAKDNEGMAYVPKDGSVWIADDDGRALYELNASTGALKRTIGASTLAATPSLGGGGSAGTNRVRDFESLAYDQTKDILYAFSGSCCTVDVLPTAFRLDRVSGKLQPDAYQALPTGSDFTAAGWNPGDGRLYVGVGSVIRTYDFGSNGVGSGFSISGVTGILGMDFTDDGQDLMVARAPATVTRVSWSSRTVVPGWDLDLRPFGLLDTRAVEVVGDQMYVSDGYDFRPAGDPKSHAVFVFDGIGSGGSTSPPSPSPSKPSTSPSPSPPPSPSPSPAAPAPSTAPLTAPKPSNLLRNGAFEQGLGGWSTAGHAGIELVRVRAAHTGTYAGKVRTTSRSAHVLFVRSSRTGTSGQPDHTYTATLWVRTRSDLRLVLHLREAVDGDRVQDVHTSTTSAHEWQRLEVSLAPHAAGRSTLRVLLTAKHAHHPSAMSFDDATLTVS